MSALITVLCWGVLIVWLGRHEFGIARDRLAEWRARRDDAERFGESVDRLLAGRTDEAHARVLLFPTTGRTVMGTPKTEARAAQTAEPLNGGAISDDRRS